MNTLWTTNQLRLRGINRRQIQNALRHGKLFRIYRGHYLNQEPTPDNVLQALHQIKPRCRTAGKTAHEQAQGQALTFPLIIEVPRNKAVMKCKYFQIFETRCNDFRKKQPPLRALSREHTNTSADERRAFLERAYEGKNGGRRLAQDRKAVRHKPASMMHALEQAQIGCDSHAERKFFKAAAQRGLKFEHNAWVGPYRYDGVNTRRRIIVEIDGETYHRADTGRSETFEQFEIDRWKDISAGFRGFRVLRFTSDMVERYFEKILDVLEAFIRGGEMPKEVRDPIWTWKTLKFGQRWEWIE
ncbi:type IV toxin-antitoxin system AbiEi family antitoxin domain-containing protein [Corynebacterium gerontici]|uniref:DUF559 domain-containing protein n=1 Tax=Corynebacterium gerontici TaxID=2079234 RepID=A0A3G6IY52_9CORY|nr:type IV toxin-antitoxin system AbiEi family antitoxin domain-containing protein [Corynebacterium gerontici]AZA10701.1 hypothetical protein CGERO_01840 [Corynebacterium gerontici]